MRWLDAFRCKCPVQADMAEPAEREEPVPLHSPARALARSLTDPETRGEWKSEIETPYIGTTLITNYRNEARDVKITWFDGTYIKKVRTPFTLTKPEEEIVRRAVRDWEAWRSEVREAEALARLIGPKPANKNPVAKAKP